MNTTQIELKDYLNLEENGYSILIKPGEKLDCYLRKNNVVVFHYSGWWSISYELYKKIIKII